MADKMTQEIEASEIKRAEDYLKMYRMNGKLLRLERYEREYFKQKDNVDLESIGEIPLARARMYTVRHFINSLPNSDEKIFLYYHYIKGENVEKCAVLLGVGRVTAYRLKKRALIMAVNAMRELGSD